jgi:hemerythrin superfamily protein
MATKPTTKSNRTQERKSRRSQPPDRRNERAEASLSAFDLLERDHRDVEEWFDEYDELQDNRRKTELAEKICLALRVHAQIEEEIFYPEARKATKDNDLIDEAVVEHATVKNLINEIEEMKFGEDLYDAKVRVLGEMVKQHIREEEDELFPEVESAKMDVQAVGEKLVKRKDELLSELQNSA